MKFAITNLGKMYKDYPGLGVSFFTRTMAMECCFGDPKEEEPNLAYSILISLKKVTFLIIFLVEL